MTGIRFDVEDALDAFSAYEFFPSRDVEGAVRQDEMGTACFDDFQPIDSLCSIWSRVWPLMNDTSQRP